MFDTFRQGLSEKISLVDLDDDTSGNKCIFIKTTLHHTDRTKDFEYEVTKIPVSAVKPYKIKIVDGHQYAY